VKLFFLVGGKTHCALIAARASDVSTCETWVTCNRHLRVLIQFATKWSLTLQVLSYMGG
jgi:hypothetical protein